VGEEEKPPEKTLVKPPEKAPERPPEKALEKQPPEKPLEKIPEKPPERVQAKIISRPAVPPPGLQRPPRPAGPPVVSRGKGAPPPRTPETPDLRKGPPKKVEPPPVREAVPPTPARKPVKWEAERDKKKGKKPVEVIIATDQVPAKRKAFAKKMVDRKGKLIDFEGEDKVTKWREEKKPVVTKMKKTESPCRPSSGESRWPKRSRWAIWPRKWASRSPRSSTS
jgi:hypothetical protein